MKKTMKIVIKKIKAFLSTLFHITWKDVAYCLLTILFSTLLAIVIHSFASLFNEETLIADLLNDAKEEWYMNTFFSEKNCKGAAGDNSDIVILDVKDSYSSRDKIAEIIKKTASFKPRLICVDFIFRDSESYDRKQSDILKKTIEEYKDSVKLVFVAYKNIDDPITRSFFVDSLSIECGLSNFPSFYKYIPYVEDSLPRITTVVAKELGINIDSIPNPLVINYSRKEFDSRVIEDRKTIKDNIRKTLYNKIVLIGQNDASDDIHTAPFLIKDGKEIPGIELIAYELSSLTNLSGEDNEYRHPYTYLPFCYNILIYIIALLIYVVFLNRLYLYNKEKTIPLFILVKTIWLFVSVFGIIQFCFYFTNESYYIPNIVLLTVSILYVEPFYELSMYFINKYNK